MGTSHRGALIPEGASAATIPIDVNVHGPTAAIVVAMAIATTALAWWMRDVLVAAPSTAFPLLFIVFVGGAFLLALVSKR